MSRYSFANGIAFMLVVIGMLLLISSMIYGLSDEPKWFNRFAIGLICFGFAGVIFKLKSN